MSQRSNKNKPSTLNVHADWRQLMLDYWTCWGCPKRCGVTSAFQPSGCLSSIKEEKATLKVEFQLGDFNVLYWKHIFAEMRSL